jgi:hypothetical protein
MKITIPYTGFDIEKFLPQEREQIKKISPERNKIFQPRIRFAIRNPVLSKSIILEGIIDSGAEYCFFNHEVAEALGLTIEDGEILRVCGVGGIKPAYFHNVELRFNFGSKAHAVNYELNVGFFPKEEGAYHEPCLLGEYGFFNHFKITFNLPNYNFEVEPVFD